MKLIFLLVYVVCGVVSFASSSNELALTLFQQAQQSFDKGHLRESETLAKRAIEIVAADGNIKTNLRNLYNYKRLGRKSAMTSQTYGDDNTYSPNQLLSRITSRKQAIVAKSQQRSKRLYPPRLLVRSNTVSDEDGNDMLSALEHGVLRISLVNAGKGVAENIKITIDDDGLGLQNPHLKQHIKSMQPGQEIVLSYTFSMPEDLKGSRNKILLNISEQDGLGEVHNHPIELRTRRYFAPVLAIEHIAKPESVIVANKRTTSHFKITNIGKETAFDVSLALNFGYTSRVRLLHDLDMNFIPFLTPGESRTVSFTIEPTSEAITEESLGVAITHSVRGREALEYQTPLFLTIKTAQRTPATRQFLSHLSRFEFTRNSADKSNNVALIIDLNKNQYGAQFNNITFMQDFFAKSAGIPAKRIIMATSPDAAHQNNDNQYDLAPWLVKKIKTLNPSLLMVYVNGSGQFDFQSQQASLHLPDSRRAKYLPLQHLVSNISALTFAPVTLFIETDLLQTQHKTEFKHAPIVYMTQDLLPSLPNNMQLAVATQAGQASSHFGEKAVGTFTFALAETLDKALQLSPLNNLTLTLAMAPIQRRTSEISQQLHAYQQRPSLQLNLNNSQPLFL